MMGVVYGLGVGPGDPELITLKAARLLRGLAVVAYPVQEDGTSIARNIAAALIAPGAVEIAIDTPMNGLAEEGYVRAAETIAGHLDAGRDVGVLCEGDPLFYGSFGHLFQKLADRHTVEVVPGVSSLTAVAAAARTPLAARNDVLTVLPGTLPDERLRERLIGADAVAIMKVGRHLGRLHALLDGLGLLPRALFIERASHPDQRVLPLAEVTADKARYFSMIIVPREDTP